MRFRCATAALLAAGGAACGAAAATFDFTTAHGREGRSFDYTVDGLSLTVSGAAFGSAGVWGYGGLVGAWSTGLGLRTSHRDAHTVDGSGYDDLLLFSFGEDVRLTSVSFSYADSNDDFTLFAEGSGGLGNVGSWALAPTGSTTTYEFQSAWLGSVFGVGAAGGDDEFKIRSVSIERLIANHSGTAVVPIPPALALIATAMLGLFIMGRRRA